MYRVVVATNVFVASAMNQRSHAARIISAIQRGVLKLCWNIQTRDAVATLLKRQGVDRALELDTMFRYASYSTTSTDLTSFQELDSETRLFAALAAATNATLITQSPEILKVRSRLPIKVMTPGEFMVSVGA